MPAGPGELAAREALGELLEELGDVDGARAGFERIMADGSDPDAVNRALLRLAAPNARPTPEGPGDDEPEGSWAVDSQVLGLYEVAEVLG